ncbi:transposable element Tcb2 transposase [Trichonephila clavipes]|nr:transposable element Tcb2 transposase [Trichonephila clavipes]
MSFTRRPGSGRPRQTSHLEDRHIVRSACVQPTTSSATIQAQTPTHRRLRLELSRARGNWTAADWNQVVFSDESRLNISSDDIRVWRPRGERLNPAFALQRHTASRVGVMGWGAIAYNTLFPLVLIRDTMTAQRYVYDILQPHVFPLMQWLPEATFSKTMFGLAWQGCPKTISALLLPFLGLPDPQICLSR